MKKKPNIKDFTFTKDVNLFGDPVVMVFRNTDKKHIMSVGEEHLPTLEYQGYDPYSDQDVLDFLWVNYKSNFDK